MIITKTPFRMSYVGGGSDISSYYRHEAGAVLSTAINKYMYITLHTRFSSGIRVAYSKTEEVEHLDEIKHPLVREALRAMNLHTGIEITSTADIPSHGSGLGSSSSYTVGLLNALHAYKGVETHSLELAEMACDVEIHKCLQPIGKQDQYAAAFGGLKLYQFNPDETVNVTPVSCSKKFLERLNQSTLIFYIGNGRSASSILTRQSKNSGSMSYRVKLRRMTILAHEFKLAIEQENFLSLGELLKENWALKKTLDSSISNTVVEQIYTQGMNAGAIGGKLLGAGEGGFVMFLAEQKNHKKIANALSKFRLLKFNIEENGSKVIYHG